MTYKLINDWEGKLAAIRKTDDNGNKFFIPLSTGNRDYQDYLAWVAEGNTADPADQTVYKLTNRT